MYYYYNNMEENTCKRCGSKWISRVEHPIQCPRCKSLDWDEDKYNEVKQK